MHTQFGRHDATDKLVTGIENSDPILINNAILAHANLNDEKVRYALTKANPNIVDQLLNSGMKVDNQNNFGMSLLHNAVLNYNKEQVEVLLKHKANIHLKNEDELTPIDYALKEENVELILLFQKYGLEDERANALIKNVKAILNDIETTCKNIFANSAPYVDAFTRHASALSNNQLRINFLKELKKTEAELDQNDELKQKTSDLEKFFAIMQERFVPYLSSDGHFSIPLKELILELAKQDGFQKGNNYLKLTGQTDFSPFISSMFVINGKNLPLEDQYSFTEEFVKLKINFNEQDNKWGNTIFHFMISNAESEACVRLLKNLFLIDGKNRGGLDLNVLATGFGTTPLHLAIEKGYRDYSVENEPVLNYVK